MLNDDERSVLRFAINRAGGAASKNEKAAAVDAIVGAREQETKKTGIARKAWLAGLAYLAIERFRRAEASHARFRSTDSRAVLTAGIDRLPDPHRQVMRLLLLGDQSPQAIAAELGVQLLEAEYMIGEGAQALRKLLGADTPPRREVWQRGGHIDG